MLAPTHSVFGIFLTLIFLAVFGIQWSLHWTIIMFSIIGAIIPDIDHPRSVIGKLFPFISIPLERRFGHRTITHSFIGWAIFTAIFAFIVLFAALLCMFILKSDIWILQLAPRWIAAFSISYMSHLILDMFNKRGSQMFWPNPSRDVIPKNPKFRPESGSSVEPLIFFVLFILMLFAFPISKYGIASSLRWLMATPGSAIMEFQSLKTHSYVDFKGYITETKDPIEGTGEILDVDKGRLVVLYKDPARRSLGEGGKIYTLSDELAADITASHVRLKRTTIPIKITKKDFENESRDALLAQIPAGALVSGTVKLPEGMDIQFPTYPSSYKPLNEKSGNLILSYASKDQITALALTETFDLEKMKDQADLSQLYAQADKLKSQITDAETGNNLTPLGQELMMSKDDIQKQKAQLADLKSQLDGINVKIDELGLKIKARKFVFSGEVYLRQ
jgi:inner membrane protein